MSPWGEAHVPRTISLDLDPLGDATRQRAEVKMTGAHLMDLIDERDAAIASARAAWGEAEAATRALREILDIESIEDQHHTLHFVGDAMGRDICSACGFLWPCVFDRARALVGSANARGSSVRTQESAP